MTRPQITVILTLLILIDLGLCWFLIRSYFSIRSTVLSPVATPDIILTAKNFPDVENLRLRFVGDIMLGRSVNLRMMRYSDYLWPFRETLHNLPAPDFFMGNLETPITDPCEPTSSGMVFCTPAKAIEGLNYAGLDMVSLANNHTLNQGKDGLFETQNHLDQAGINHIIHSQYQTVQVKNINLGVIAFDDITYPLTKDQITESLEVIPNPPDLWIAYLHWGNEYQASPSARQRQIAAWLQTEGIHLIIGSHPHVLQPIEKTSDTQLIAYSLGNFVFDQMWSEPTRKSIILDLDLEFVDHQLSRISTLEHPVTIYDFGQPHLSP